MSIHPSCHGDERYFFELINLKGVQPYALIRGSRQFGQVQVIPLRSDMDHNKYEFGQNDPEVHNILRRWERVITIDTGIRLSFYILEYYLWILKEAEGKELSEEGYYGLTDACRPRLNLPCLCAQDTIDVSQLMRTCQG